MPFSWTKFEVGQIVTRLGTDMHEVIEARGDSQLILVKCIKPDHNNTYEKGELESNLARRYTLYGSD